MTRPAIDTRRRRNLAIALGCTLWAGAMVGAAYAAVPLYDWFCRTTGFGGRTQVATAAPAETLERKITIRLDANVGPGLAWKFEPEVNQIEARLGEVVTLHYRVRNLTARQTIGNAAYNVSPPALGIHFQKINCFCFTEQTLAPGEAREMPVVFYIDPALAKDSTLDGVNTITLSYTMYAVKAPEPVAQNARAPGGRI